MHRGACAQVLLDASARRAQQGRFRVERGDAHGQHGG
jgi:hypothetical protein